MPFFAVRACLWADRRAMEKARLRRAWSVGRKLLRGFRFTAERLCSCHRCFFRRSARRAGVRYSIACADNGRYFTGFAAMQQALGGLGAVCW